VKADYAAQELRILAHITGDEKLITSFAEGVDPHVVVGEKVAGHSLEKGTTEYKTYRKLGKRANYGFSYGAGAARYAQSAYEDTAERVSEEQARAEQEAFRTAWPGVYRWQQEFGDADGTDETDWYTLSFVGRRRYVGQKKDKYSGGYKPSYCDRLNAPIQSGGADMLYVALELLLKDKEDGLFPEVEVIITTHDEIVLEAPEEVGKSTQAWLERRMQDAARRFLREELAGEDCVEGEVGPSWGGR
jgi:DNA polymerase-1